MSPRRTPAAGRRDAPGPIAPDVAMISGQARAPAAPVGLVRELVLASRPLSWVNTGLPFLAAGFEAQRALDPLLVLGTLYFLVPYNLLMYGVNDIFDYASDLANPRKRSLEGGLVPPDRRTVTWTAIALANIPFLLLFAAVAPPAGTVAVLAAVVAALIYSAPPLRTKERPFLDSLTSASHFVLPAVAGFLMAGMSPDALPLAMLGGFVTWGVASHALGAIQDIAYDRAAGIGSIATAIGARPTAALSLAGYAIAAIVAAGYGGLAILAGASLTAYLLLPAAVLASPIEPQARRAWRSFLGLNLLVGFVLTQLLLRHWGLVVVAPDRLLAGAAVVMPAICLLGLAANERALRAPRHEAAAAPDPLPLLSVVVPARDEASRLPVLIRALAGQDHPDLQLIVVDDGSTDGTAGVATRELRAARPTFADRDLVIDAGPKPEGWAGKSWAAHRGAGHAAATHLLFLDADTIPAPGALTTLHRIAVGSGAGLLSGVTAYGMPTSLEQALLPGFPMTMLGLVPIWAAALAGNRSPRLAFAYGPALLAERSAYAASGGHAATPGSEREDLDLARTIAGVGRPVIAVRAADLAVTRHYPDGWGAVRAWRRVALAYVGDSFANLLLALGFGLAAWVFPLVVPLIGLVTGDAVLVAGGLAGLVLLIVFRLALAVLEHEPLRSIAWHPVTASVTMVGQVASLVDGVLGRPPIWRGRPYERWMR